MVGIRSIAFFQSGLGGPVRGDGFGYDTPGENAVGRSGVTFTVTADRAGSVRVENLDHTGLGTFQRD